MIQLILKRHLHWWFQTIVAAIINHECLDCFAVTFQCRVKCNKENIFVVVKSIEFDTDPELFFMLILDLLRWILHLHDLVEICNNIEWLVEIVAERTN